MEMLLPIFKKIKQILLVLFTGCRNWAFRIFVVNLILIEAFEHHCTVAKMITWAPLLPISDEIIVYFQKLFLTAQAIHVLVHWCTGTSCDLGRIIFESCLVELSYHPKTLCHFFCLKTQQQTWL